MYGKRKIKQIFSFLFRFCILNPFVFFSFLKNGLVFIRFRYFFIFVNGATLIESRLIKVIYTIYCGIFLVYIISNNCIHHSQPHLIIWLGYLILKIVQFKKNRNKCLHCKIKHYRITSAVYQRSLSKYSKTFLCDYQ